MRKQTKGNGWFTNTSTSREFRTDQLRAGRSRRGRYVDRPAKPAAPLVARAQEAGYPGAQTSGEPQAYFAYYFRVLTGQGPNSPEGAMNYIAQDGEMTKGFALIAWAASYGASGIMSFVVNQDGIVFQKDLGPQTTSVAARIKLYDPDLSWSRVDITN